MNNEKDKVIELAHKMAAHILDEWMPVHNKFNLAIQSVINENHVGYETTYVTMKVILNHLERNIRLHYGARADDLIKILDAASETIEMKSEEVGKTSARQGTSFSPTGF